MTLDTYNRKRDFTRTDEPVGEPVDVPRVQNRFVVQEHHASHLHYDFRLEIGGILVSWAVPKGPPPAPGVRRLAVKTEDHPPAYIDFHGVIGPGNYGAGEVSIWDTGTFIAATDEDPEESVRRGKIEVYLAGKRLQGKYDLVRIDDEKDQWLFLKSRDSGDRRQTAASSVTQTFSVQSAPAAPMPAPGSINPMLAVTVAQPFSHPDWRFEIKWDGYRALLYADRSGESLVSRNRIPLSDSFPELRELRRWIDCDSAVIDGEIVALSSDGRPQFQALQRRMRPRGAQIGPTQDTDIAYMVFDLIHCDGRDLTPLPLTTRREMLIRIVRPGGPVRFSDDVSRDGEALFEQLRALGMEGMVAKRADSPYVQRRSDHWAKIKTHRTLDVVIGGYTESPAATRPFGSLLIGLYAGGELVSVGHVGSGFNAATMKSLKSSMDDLAVGRCPFGKVPRANAPAHWIDPKIVCEVGYAEMTGDGALRHPVFLQLRPDKAAEECRLATSMEQSTVSVPGRKAEHAPRAISASPADSAAADLASALSRGAGHDEVHADVGGRRVSLTHLGKVYWPQTGSTKRDLLRYYAEVSDALLPHLADRPMMVQRFPDGVAGKSFFQHDTGSVLPDYARTYEVEEHGHVVRYALCDDLPTLLSVVNLGAIPLHLWNIRASAPENPDRIVFDLDPAGDFSTAVYVAHAVRSVLDELGLQSYPKTSGASGLHIYVPIEPIYRAEDVAGFARLAGEATRQRMPDVVTLERRIKNRGDGLVYLDCMQNGVGKTVVAPYSVRPQPTPTVSSPLAWDEVTVRLNPAAFTIETVPERLRSLGDLFGSVLDRPQPLAAWERLKEKALQ